MLYWAYLFQDSGNAPNPWWRTLSLAELRWQVESFQRPFQNRIPSEHRIAVSKILLWQGRFRALIPVEDLALGDTQACYKVRFPIHQYINCTSIVLYSTNSVPGSF